MKKNKRLYWVLGGVILILVVAAYLSGNVQEVQTITAEKGTIQRVVVENGIVNARTARDLYTETGGKIISLPVEAGESLQQDEIIAVLDNPAIPLSISNAQTQLAQVKAAIAAQQASLAGINTEFTAANRQLARIEELYKAGGASLAEYDNAILAAEKLQKSLEDLNNSMSYYRLQEESLAEALKIARDNQDKLTIKCPFAGKLMYLACEEGQIIAAGTAVAGVAVAGELEVMADVLSDDIAEIAEGQTVLITAPVLGNTILSGQVVRIYPQAEEKLSALGVIQRRVPVLINLPEAAHLKPGFEVRAEIQTVRKENVLFLPRGAVRTNQDDQQEVMAVVNGRTVVKAVDTGLYDNENIEILNGIEEGDLIIKEAGTQISAGTRVKTAQ